MSDDIQLVEITEPMVFDVVLSRLGENGHREPVTNVPRSTARHSPDGFEWGYGGSGPSDLALNILNAFIPPGADDKPPEAVQCGKLVSKVSRTAFELYPIFKRDFLIGMPKDGGMITAQQILAWLAAKRRALRRGENIWT